MNQFNHLILFMCLILFIIYREKLKINHVCCLSCSPFFHRHIGKQAVLVLSCDNPHMSDDVMVEPGLVMIFAHGVE